MSPPLRMTPFWGIMSEVGMHIMVRDSGRGVMSYMYPSIDSHSSHVGRAPSVVRLLCALAITLCAVFGMAARPAFAATDGSISLYNSAAGAAVYMDMMLHNGKGKEFADGEGISAGNNIYIVSGALGYPDLEAINNETMDPWKKSDPETPGWTTQLTMDEAKNSAIYAYSSFSGYGAAAPAIKAYGDFGCALGTLGLDSMAAGDGLTNPVRIVIGGLINGLYHLSNASDVIVDKIVDVMKFTNPFRLFGYVPENSDEWKTTNAVDTETMNVSGGGWERGNTVVTGSDVENGNIRSVGSGGDHGIVDAKSLFEVPGVSDIANQLIGIYRALYGLSAYVLIPLSVVITIATYLMGRASMGQNSSLVPKVRRYLIRVAFLVAGIPMLGLCYTATLNNLSDGNDSWVSGGLDTHYNMSDVVLHSFVDFGAWAERTNLAIDQGSKIVIEVDSNGDVADASWQHIADTAYAINSMLYANDASYGAAFSGGKEAKPADDGAYDYGYWVQELDGGSDKADQATREAQNAIVSYLLSSYMRGETYSAGAYASSLNSKVLSGQTNANDVYQFLWACANPETYAKNLATLATDSGASVEVKSMLSGGSAEYVASVKSNEALTKLRDELAKATDPDEFARIAKEILEKEKEAKQNTGAAGGNTEIKIAGHLFDNGSLALSNNRYYGDATYGLSDVGMYNYLNTDFHSSEFVVYSSSNSVNKQSHPAHYRVSLVGGAILGPIMAANAGLLMLAVAITGIVYGLGMLFSSIKRSFLLILSLPMAFTGMIRSIAHAILLALAMVCEILGTIFAYHLMKSLLISINKFISEGIVAKYLIGALGGGTGSGFGLVGALISYLVSCVFLIIYILLALRLRAAITNALTDMVSSILSRITDVNPGDVTSSGSSFVDSAVIGMASNPVGSLAGMTVAGTAVAGGMAAMGDNGDITLGGSTSSATAEGGDGADGGSNMLTGAYGSSGGIEDSDRQLSASIADGSASFGGDAYATDGSMNAAYASGGDGGDGSVGRASLAQANANAFGDGGAGGAGGTGAGGYGAGGDGVGGDGTMHGAVQGEGALASAVASAGYGLGGDAYSSGYGMGGAGGSGTGEGGAGGAGGAGEGGYGSASAAGAALSAAAFGSGVGGDAYGAGGAGGSGSGYGQGGDAAGGAGGIGYGAEGYGAGGVGANASMNQNLRMAAAGGDAVGVGVGGDGSALAAGASLASVAYGAGGAGGMGYGAGGAGGASQAAGGAGGVGLGASSVGGAASSMAEAEGLGIGGRSVATSGDAIGGVGGDGTSLANGAYVNANAVGGRGGDGTFRGTGGAYDRDLAAGGVSLDPRVEGLRGVSVQPLASAISGAPGANGAMSTGNVDLGASVPHFGSGTLAPNVPTAAQAAGQTTSERIREVQGRSEGHIGVGGPVSALSASIGSAHSDATIGGDVRSSGGVNAGGAASERRRDVRGSASALGNAVGAAGGAGVIAGRAGGAGGSSSSSASSVGAPGAPGAPGSSGGSGAAGAAGGSGMIEGGLRTPHVSVQSGPAGHGAAPLSAAAGIPGRPGTPGRDGASGGVGRSGASGTAISTSHGGSASFSHGASRSVASGTPAASSHGTTVVGLGHSASPGAPASPSAADRASRAHAASAERFSRAMGGTQPSKPKADGNRRRRGSEGTDLGEAVSGRGGAASKGVDTGSFSGHDPLGRR